MGLPPKNQAEIDASNQYRSFLSGWRDGAASKPLDPKFMGHTNALIRGAYEDGYSYGRKALNDASEKASQVYGFKPNILRLADAEIEA